MVALLTWIWSHHSTSATLIEQRDIVHAILTLQTEQQRERDNKTDPENTSPSNTPPLASAIPTPGESEKDETEARPFLEIFLLKPMVRDVGEVVELSWHVRKLSISQSQISAQLAMDRGGSLPVSEIYESLYDHEHKAINGEIENSTSPAALLSLKRRYMNLRHREMIFYGVLSLRFIIRRGRVSPMDMETNSVRLDCMPTQSRGAETTESEHEKAAGYGTGYRAPSPVASFRTTEHLAGDGIGYGSMRKRGRPPRARPRNIPMFNDTEEHIPNSLTSFNQEGSMRWSSFGRECVSVGEVPVERRPSLFPGEPANAPQDEMGNGTEDKSPDEADVQRIVEQLLSKYTTIFEKGLVP